MQLQTDSTCAHPEKFRVRWTRASQSQSRSLTLSLDDGSELTRSSSEAGAEVGWLNCFTVWHGAPVGTAAVSNVNMCFLGRTATWQSASRSLAREFRVRACLRFVGTSMSLDMMATKQCRYAYGWPFVVGGWPFWHCTTNATWQPQFKLHAPFL